MAPLTNPQRPQGGLRAPFLDYPRGSVGAVHSRAPEARSTVGGCTAVRLRRRRELELYVIAAGQSAALLPVLI